MTAQQPDFAAALLNPDVPTPGNLVGPAGAPVTARFNVYRNNVTSSLIEAMRTGFPVIEKLVGATNFKTLALMYVRKHPPVSPLLMFYGQNFPDFIADFEPLRAMPYMADIARLELLRRDAYHAADAPVFDSVALQAAGDAALMAGKLVTAPATRVLQSQYPVYDIWVRNTADEAHPISQGGQSVLITRPGFDVDMTLISAPMARFLLGLSDATVGVQIERTLSETPDFPLGDAFALIIQTGFATRLSKVTP